MIWLEIRTWYSRNGYHVTSQNMGEIMREWSGNEQRLLSILKRHSVNAMLSRAI